jgi:hypothetical protein
MASLAAGLLAACEDKAADSKADAGVSAEVAAAQTKSLTERCDALGTACGEKDKHKSKIAEECKEAAKTQGEKGCGKEVLAAYDCFEKEVCTESNKIWALDDFRVLTERTGKCVEQRKSAQKCVTGNE